MVGYNTIYVGMDTHKKTTSVCAFYPMSGEFFAQSKFENFDSILKYLRDVSSVSPDARVICGYEAGCTGFALYRYLREHGIKCKVIAPSTIKEERSKRHVKTDRLDAQKLARALAFDDCKFVTVPTTEIEAIRDYIRMRDDLKAELKRIKQHIKAFCLRHNKQFDKKESWNKPHLDWLRKLTFVEPLFRETLDEYLIHYDYLTDKIVTLDKRILEIAERPEYKDKVKNLSCIKGITPLSALAYISEIGDFNRFKSAGQFASFLGLTPGEHSSSENEKKLSITKAGNTHMRRLLIEAAHSYKKGAVSTISSTVKQRQKDAPAEIITYANKASRRLRRKYLKMTIEKNKSGNVAATAVARELSGFIWGMMTGHHQVPPAAAPKKKEKEITVETLLKALKRDIKRKEEVTNTQKLSKNKDKTASNNKAKNM